MVTPHHHAAAMLPVSPGKPHIRSPSLLSSPSIHRLRGPRGFPPLVRAAPTDCPGRVLAVLLGALVAHALEMGPRDITEAADRYRLGGDDGCNGRNPE
ncbi:hypothetical protein DL765_009298 [Monosporascus sp. GIB2]|nr:hypothetical protein DL765_009298 [Monosporascus sp. GIB2]